MKAGILAFFLGLVTGVVFPLPALLFWMFVVIVLDFFTGVGKAVATGIPRTSGGYRDTVGKFVQYGGGIAISIVLATVASYRLGEDPWIHPSMLVNTLVAFIIFAESTSILENLEATMPNSKVSRYFFRPLLKLVTIKLENFFPNNFENKITTTTNTVSPQGTEINVEVTETKQPPNIIT